MDAASIGHQIRSRRRFPEMKTTGRQRLIDSELLAINLNTRVDRVLVVQQLVSDEMLPVVMRIVMSAARSARKSIRKWRAATGRLVLVRVDVANRDTVSLP